MRVRRLVFLVEDRSMEAFLDAFLPRRLPAECSYEIHPMGDKPQMLKKLSGRLTAYAHWLPEDWRIVILIDRDDEDCIALKHRLEQIAQDAGLRSRSRVSGRLGWQVVNRIAVAELEAWYFGDWQAVCAAFPKVPAKIAHQARYRNPDALKGGTWEAFERVLQRYGYYPNGLDKIDAARRIGGRLDPARSRSASFACFYSAVQEALA